MSKVQTFVTPEERQLIEAVLAFANLRRVRTTDQVERLFSRLPFVDKPFKVLRPDEVHVFAEGQQVYQGWLAAIPRSRAVREEVGREVDAVLRRAVTVTFRFDRGRLAETFRLDGVEACVAYALALVLDERRGLTSRLQRCDAPGCGKFRLDFETKGRPGKYCSREHKVAAEIVRRKEA